MWAIAPVALLLFLSGASLFARRLRHCQHRFGLPVSGHVRCMKCFHLFRIEATQAGEWKIASRPEKEEGLGIRD